MKRKNYSTITMAICIAFAMAACNKGADNNAVTPAQQKANVDALISENGTNPDEAGLGSASSATASHGASSQNEIVTNSISGSWYGEGHHFVYTESNGTGGNQILTYKIGKDGSLQLVNTTASGGTGTGAGLASQGALALSDGHELLFAVNAGSNSVSSFTVSEDGSIWLAHTESSGGKTPVSVSVKGNLLYVLNTGSDSIQGFRVREDGSFWAIEGSKQALSGAGVGGAEISFTPNGDWLLVTEKATNNISAFRVKSDGSVWPDAVTPSTGQTPYGFDFARDRFAIVSDAAGGAAAAGATTSYSVSNHGPKEINGAVSNEQSAPCWVAVTAYGRFAFVTNTASNSISSYYISEKGDLTLVHQSAASTDNTPIDIVVAKNNYNVYELNAKANTIGEYYRIASGGLVNIGSVGGLPTGAAGLVTF